MPRLLHPFFDRRQTKLIIATLLMIVMLVQPLSAEGKHEGSEKNRILKPFCHDLTPGLSSVSVGGSGTILFNCNGRAAFAVNLDGQAVPEFSLPPGYTLLTIVSHVKGAMACTPGSTITPNTSFHFTASGGFDYCVKYSNAPNSGLASFNLEWQTPHGHKKHMEHEREDKDEDKN